MAALNFLSSAKSEAVSDTSRLLLLSLAEESGNGSISISSTARSPYDQARIMFDNCLKLGVKSQYRLYKRFGDKIIDVFKKLTSVPDYKRDEVIKAMMDKINEVGPSKVSMHCVDTQYYNVVDIPFSSVTDKDSFRKAIKTHMPFPITKFLDESNNNCFHIEIVQSAGL
ncbi:MAG TPA: hypothetical protein PLP23_10570 [Panacibacter sp.]|nr:hypothetical protein [Panacibacter sp.]